MSKVEFDFIDVFRGQVDSNNLNLNFEKGSLKSSRNMTLSDDRRSLRKRKFMKRDVTTSLISAASVLCDNAYIIPDDFSDLILFPVYDDNGGYLRLYYPNYTSHKLEVHHAEGDKISYSNPLTAYGNHRSYLVDMAILSGKLYLVSDYNGTFYYDYSGTKTFTQVIPGGFNLNSFRFVRAFKNHLFLVSSGYAGYTRDTVRFSDIGDGTSWSAANIFQVGNDSYDIVGVGIYRNYFVFFKEKSIYVLTGTDEDTFAVIPIVKGFGCVSALTIVETTNGIYFVSNTGYLYLYDGSSLRKISETKVMTKHIYHPKGAVDLDNNIYILKNSLDDTFLNTTMLAIDLETGIQYDYLFDTDQTGQAYRTFHMFNSKTLQKFYPLYVSNDNRYGFQMIVGNVNLGTLKSDHFYMLHKVGESLVSVEYADDFSITTTNILRESKRTKKIKRLYINGYFKENTVKIGYDVDGIRQQYIVGTSSDLGNVDKWITIDNPVGKSLSITVNSLINDNDEADIFGLGVEYVNLRRNIG